MPGVYLEYIKAGKFVVPVELTFQTEAISVDDGIRGLVNTSKWVERHNWKEIKAMLKPAVEACLKFNDTPAENIPKSHHITYGENVSLGYLIVANKLLTPFLSVLDTKKNCWSEDEEDEDELLGLKDQLAETDSMDDHGGEFTECIPTNTAIRVCVVKKSIVSIDDARRIRKELGVRSEDVRHYFSAPHLNNEPGTSSMLHNQYHENNQQSDRAASSPKLGSTSPRFDEASDSETENIPRTYGDPEEIRDISRIYTAVINRDRGLESHHSDVDSLPDIEPNPPKKKKQTRTRKKSASLSPSKAKRLTHNTILAVTQEGQANFSEEDSTYSKRKKSKRKRTVAVVEPMRTLPNGQISFEHAIGALTDKKRKPRPNSSHGADKGHGGRSKQPPAIDIIAPDDDRLTITNQPEPIPVIQDSPSCMSTPPKNKSPDHSSSTKSKNKRKPFNLDEDRHKWERLTPSPFVDEDDEDTADVPNSTYLAGSDSDSDMPILYKEVLSEEETLTNDDEINSKQTGHTVTSTDAPVIVNLAKANEHTINNDSEAKSISNSQTNSSSTLPSISISLTKSSSPSLPLTELHSGKKKVRTKRSKIAARRKRAASSSSSNSDEESTSKVKNQSSPDITKIKFHATIRKNCRKKLQLREQSKDKENSSSEELGNLKSKMMPRRESQRRSSPLIKTEPVKQSPSPTLTRAEVTAPRHSPRIQSPAISPRNLRRVEELVDPQMVERPKPSPSKVTQEIFGRPKPKRKIKSRRGRPPKHISAAKSKPKPVMGDAQTQTEDLNTQIERRSTTPNLISNALLKIRGYAESSEDELSNSRSRTPLITERISATPIHHPALGSPKIDASDEEGLFDFDSPTVPVSRTEQSSQPHEENEAQVHSPESVVERSPSPQSPKPGCSHWKSTPRSVSPQITDLMPPPAARPPRTPRKMLDDKSDISDDLEHDILPMGAEASTVIRSIGRVHRLMHQTNVFDTGLSLIEKITKDGLRIDKRNGYDYEALEDNKALVPVATVQRKRDLSPDICELVPGKKNRLVVTKRASRKDTMNHFPTSGALVATHSGAMNEGTANNSLLMDLATRSEEPPPYEPCGDEFDLSQRSLCMRNFVSDYDRKSRLCKIHGKVIQDTSIDDMKEHFLAVLSDLFAIYQGSIPSHRHNMFNEVQDGITDKQDLQNNIFAMPFNSEQIGAMYEQIRKAFPRGESPRTLYNEYIDYVLMPETLVRLYSRINQVPYPIAETEMQYKAFYEGKVSESDRTSLPAIQ